MFYVYLGSFLEFTNFPEIWIAFDSEYYDYYVVDAFTSDNIQRYIACEFIVEGVLQPASCTSESHMIKIRLLEANIENSELLSSVI